VKAGSRQRGQAVVETVLVLPFVVMVLLMVIQVAVLARAQVLVTDAAREGARAASLGGTSAEVARAARATPGLEPSRLAVSSQVEGDTVAVTVRYRAPTDVAIAGSLVGDRELTATIRMQVEDTVAVPP
jgi:Flp pilus assembly protein TadG